jgi:hypothetical protein
MNEKEVWVYLLAYNLIRLLMAASARQANMLPREISFKHTRQMWLGMEPAWSALRRADAIGSDRTAARRQQTRTHRAQGRQATTQTVSATDQKTGSRSSTCTNPWASEKGKVSAIRVGARYLSGSVSGAQAADTVIDFGTGSLAKYGITNGFRLSKWPRCR